MEWLPERVPRPANYQFTKFGQLDPRDPREGAKIMFQLLFLTQRPILRKIQGGLSDKEKLRECLLFDNGCTGWQSTPQNLLNIELPNSVP